MSKPNINMKANIENLKVLLEVSKGIDHHTKDGNTITVDYDNVNLVNHIPFADKNKRRPQIFCTEYK